MMEILRLYDHTTNTWKSVPAIKGEDGISGVYYGTDTPPANSGATVWVNPNGTATESCQTYTDGVWEVRKWTSGWAECWTIDKKNHTSTAAMGNMYHSVGQSISLPSGLFVEKPLVRAQLYGGGVFICAQLVTINMSAISYGIITATSGTFNNAEVYFMVRGKWK